MSLILSIVIAVVMVILGIIGFTVNLSGLSIDELLEDWRDQKERNG
jgi:hypothetical protein